MEVVRLRVLFLASFFIYELLFMESKCHSLVNLVFSYLQNFLRNTSAKVSGSIPGHG